VRTTALKSLIWICAITLCALPLSADGPQTGTIDGTVTDAQGTGLPGVSVTLTGPQNTRNAVTDAGGGYRFALLQAGAYKVNAALEGLGAAEQAVNLDAGQRRGVDLSLQAAASETITVTSEAALISKYDAGATASISEEINENVTFATRNYNSSVRQLPGMVNPNQDGDFQPSINGGIRTELGVFVDGVDVSMPRRGGEMRFQLPNTSVTETRVETAGFQAEYGRATTGVLNTAIKTGTNNFHGDFLYIGQNPKWRAEDWLEIERPDQQIDSFETSLGGPLYRDKAWFFASYASMSDNRLDRLRNGTVQDLSRESEPLVAKVNFTPSSRHQIAVTAIDSPSVALSITNNPGDEFAVGRVPLNNRIQTGTWSFAMTNSAFLEFKLANREEFVDRQKNADDHAIDLDTFTIDQPGGNNFRYRDLVGGLRWNDYAVRLGEGFNDFPRDQANGSVTLFKGNHEIKVGIDIQDITFTNLSGIITEYRGRGYCPTCPGGYESPVNKRVFDPSDAVTMDSLMSAAYAQDRLEVGDHWTFSFGLRYDEQQINDDLGSQVNDYSEVAPRFSVVYDLKGDGKMLVRGTAGRYYHNIGLGIVLQEFTRQNNGENTYDQFQFNTATGLYDRFQRRVEPVSGQNVAAIDPHYKDEVSVGFDWQFADNWVFTSRAIVHETEDVFSASLQFDAAGEVVRDLRNWSNNDREYEGLSFQVNRAFRNGWSLNTNYTLSSTDGAIESFNDNDNHNEGFGGIDTVTGELNPTSGPLWFGGLTVDREHLLNVVAMKRISFGKQDVLVSGFLHYAAGEPWGLHPATTVAHPVSGETIVTSKFTENRSANNLPDFWALNLNATYQFPIAGSVQGSVGVEAANVTDEGSQTRITRSNGTPPNNVFAFQVPREFRVKVGFRF